MITVFNWIGHMEHIWPEYPAVLILPFVALFISYIIGGLYHGYNYLRAN